MNWLKRLFTFNRGKRPTRPLDEVVAAIRKAPYGSTARAYVVDIVERVHAVGRGGSTSDVEDAVRKKMMMLTDADNKELLINVYSIIDEAAPEYMEPVDRIISEVTSNLPPSRVCMVLAITAHPLPFATAERLFIDIQDEQARKGRQVSPDCKFLTSVADPDDKQHAFALLRRSGLYDSRAPEHAYSSRGSVRSLACSKCTRIVQSGCSLRTHPRRAGCVLSINKTTAFVYQTRGQRVGRARMQP